MRAPIGCMSASNSDSDWIPLDQRARPLDDLALDDLARFLSASEEDQAAIINRVYKAVRPQKDEQNEHQHSKNVHQNENVNKNDDKTLASQNHHFFFNKLKKPFKKLKEQITSHLIQKSVHRP